MKTILALALLGATILLVGGEEFSAEHAEFFDAVEDSHRPPRPRPTPPEFIRPCIAKAKECLGDDQGGDVNPNRPTLNPCKIVACAKEFGECVKANKPTNLPTPPPHVKKCFEDAKQCRNESAGDCREQLKCIFKLGHCLHHGHRPSELPRPSGGPRPTPPKFVRKCIGETHECIENAGDACGKLACAKAFVECLKANKPTNLPTGMPPRARVKLHICLKRVSEECGAKRTGNNCVKSLICLKLNMPKCLRRHGRHPGHSKEDSGMFEAEHEEFMAFL